MHLTEFCLDLHHTLALAATNAEHSSTFRTLCRMMLALPMIPGDRSRFFNQLLQTQGVEATLPEIPLRSALALAKVVNNHDAYRPDVGATRVLTLTPHDLLWREEMGEEMAAVHRAHMLLERCGVTPEQAEDLLGVAGQRWDQPGPKIFSSSCIADSIG